MKDALKAIQTAGWTRMDSRMVDVMENLEGCLMVVWRAQSSAFEMVDKEKLTCEQNLLIDSINLYGKVMSIKHT